MKKAFILLLITISSAINAQYIKLIEITTEPEPTGKTIYTFRFTPGTTEIYDLLTFELTYHQEFPFEDSSGKKYTKIHEPESFTYKRKNEKFVNELDNYINFRIPMSLELLKKMYGDRTFREEFPVTISAIKIRADKVGKKVWEYKFPPTGKFIWNEKSKKFEPADPSKEPSATVYEPK